MVCGVSIICSVWCVVCPSCVVCGVSIICSVWCVVCPSCVVCGVWCVHHVWCVVCGVLSCVVCGVWRVHHVWCVVCPSCVVCGVYIHGFSSLLSLEHLHHLLHRALTYVHPIHLHYHVPGKEARQKGWGPGIHRLHKCLFHRPFRVWGVGLGTRRGQGWTHLTSGKVLTYLQPKAVLRFITGEGHLPPFSFGRGTENGVDLGGVKSVEDTGVVPEGALVGQSQGGRGGACWRHQSVAGVEV